MNEERLTARNDKGLAYLVKVKQDEQVVESPFPNTLRAILEGFRHLADYEDITEGISLDRLKEMCEAEREGRLVVLPCKVGDAVYEPYDGRIFTRPFHGASVELHVGGGVRMMDDFGKTVFLTRPEAEAALKGAEHE